MMVVSETDSLTIYHNFNDNAVTWQDGKLDYRVIAHQNYVQINLPLVNGKPSKVAAHAVNRIALTAQLKFEITCLDSCYHITGRGANEDFAYGITC